MTTDEHLRTIRTAKAKLSVTALHYAIAHNAVARMSSNATEAEWTVQKKLFDDAEDQFLDAAIAYANAMAAYEAEPSDYPPSETEVVA